MLGTFLITIAHMVKVAEREQRNPSSLVVSNTMDKKEGRSQVSGMLALNSVHHERSMSDCKKPESSGHLLLSRYAQPIWTIVFQWDSTRLLDDWRPAGAATTLELESMRYSLIAIPKSLTSQLL
jgi:hypothetical protein